MLQKTGQIISPQSDTPTIVEVQNIDCLYAGTQLKEQGYNPAVLNMASRRNPGGGVVTGAGAQEETLFRRTNLSAPSISLLHTQSSMALSVPAFSTLLTGTLEASIPLMPSTSGIVNRRAMHCWINLSVSRLLL